MPFSAEQKSVNIAFAVLVQFLFLQGGILVINPEAVSPELVVNHENKDLCTADRMEHKTAGESKTSMNLVMTPCMYRGMCFCIRQQNKGHELKSKWTTMNEDCTVRLFDKSPYIGNARSLDFVDGESVGIECSPDGSTNGTSEAKLVCTWRTGNCTAIGQNKTTMHFVMNSRTDGGMCVCHLKIHNNIELLIRMSTNLIVSPRPEMVLNNKVIQDKDYVKISKGDPVNIKCLSRGPPNNVTEAKLVCKRRLREPNSTTGKHSTTMIFIMSSSTTCFCTLKLNDGTERKSELAIYLLSLPSPLMTAKQVTIEDRGSLRLLDGESVVFTCSQRGGTMGDVVETKITCTRGGEKKIGVGTFQAKMDFVMKSNIHRGKCECNLILKNGSEIKHTAWLVLKLPPTPLLTANQVTTADGNDLVLLDGEFVRLTCSQYGGMMGDAVVSKLTCTDGGENKVRAGTYIAKMDFVMKPNMHGGKCECNLNLKNGSEIKHTVWLVLKFPAFPVLAVNDKTIENERYFPILNRESVNIKCFTRGSPDDVSEAKLACLGDGQSTTNTGQKKTAILIHMSIAMHGGKCVCTLILKNGTNLKTTMTTILKIPDFPLLAVNNETVENAKNVSIMNGESVSIKCFSRGSLIDVSKATLVCTWDGQEHSETGLNTTSMSFVMDPQMHEGTCICTLKLTNGTELKTKLTPILKIKPVLANEDSQIYSFPIGSVIEIPILVYSNPKPNKFILSKSGIAMTVDNFTVTIEPGRTSIYSWVILNMNKMQTNKVGNYLLSIGNGLDGPLDYAFSLNITNGNSTAFKLVDIPDAYANTTIIILVTLVVVILLGLFLLTKACKKNPEDQTSGD